MGVRNVLVVVICTFLICAVKPEESQNFPNKPCELDLAQLLLLPPDSMQIQALKQDLLRYIEERLKQDDNFEKYSLDAFATDAKRSIANLAKNGQLPTFQRQDGQHDKRSIASLARNGELHVKREFNNFLNDLYEKRNLASLARTYNLPSGKRIPNFDYDDFDYDKRSLQSILRNSGKRFYDEEPSYFYDDIKRNIASIARDNSRFLGKRNVAALLRQDSYLNDAKSDDHGLQDKKNSEDASEMDAEKRNIASLKAQMKGGRTKRQADYSWINEEYPVPVYQNNGVYDYEEMIKALTGSYPETEKRFLGSVARTGWFKPVSGSGGRYQEPNGSPIAKRHIGALAKLGWLPALRSARRFHRSGRSSLADYYAVEDDRFPIPEYLMSRIPQMGRPKTTPKSKVRH